MSNIASVPIMFRLGNAESKTATVIMKHTLETDNPGFTVTGLSVATWGGAVGGGTGVTVTLKKGSSTLKAITVANNMADATEVYEDVVPTTTLMNQFKAGDLIDLAITDSMTMAAGGLIVTVWVK